ncbi:PIG-L family deacetylase [Georgenia sp. MJ173]|uniref:PIG-L family deacetylase n=1 Tax=Georgenia sunbinii TaxID=3117728 RepID=UPI002F26AEBC
MSTDLAGRHRLLGVFAHPDDETIAAGSTLAVAVAAGVDVSVVSCTRGERGEVIPPELAHLAGDGGALAARRESELAAALTELGVDRHLFLDQVPGLEGHRPARFVDSGMTWVAPGIAGPVPDAGPDAFSRVDVELAARLLAVVIRHLRPTVLLTEEPTGGYGHPDHVHAHRVAMRAVEIAAAQEPWSPPAGDAADPLDGLPSWQVSTVLWVAQAEPDLREAVDRLGRHLAAPGHGDDDGVPATSLFGADGRPLVVTHLGDAEPAGTELPGLIVPTAEITAVVDATAVVDRVLGALRAHRTQVQAVAPIAGQPLLAGRFALSNNVLMPLLDRAYIRVAPGFDGAADLVAVLTAATVPSPSLGSTPVDPRRAAIGTGAASARMDRLITGGGAAAIVMCAVVGVVMAMLGTAVHRYELGGWPVGMAVGLVGVLAGAVTARAVAAGSGLLTTVLAVVMTTQAMAFIRPGADVIVTGQPIGYVWLFGAPVMCFVAAFLPRRWFAGTGVGR